MEHQNKRTREEPQQQQDINNLGLSIRQAEGAQVGKENYHYHRYTSLKIKPIDFDCEEDQVATFQQQISTTSNFSLNFQQISDSRLSKERFQLTKEIKKGKVLKSIGQHIDPSQWKYDQSSNIPQSSLAYLKEGQKQAYSDILTTINRMVNGLISNRILFLLGPKHIGKKTLVYEALNEIAQSSSKINHYYLNLQSTAKQANEQVIKLSKFILQICVNNRYNAQSQLSSHIFVVNNPQIFFHHLKKIQLYHEFKGLVRKGKVFFVFVGLQFTNRKESWLSLNSSVINMPTLSLNTMVSLLLSTANQTSFGGTKWLLSKPLALFFCSKLFEQTTVDLSLLLKMKQFLSKKSQEVDSGKQEAHIQIRQQKVTREMLDKFRKESFDITYQINIAGLNLHEKLVLVAILRVLSEGQDLAIRLAELYKAYCWACQSLSIRCRGEKQFRQDMLTQMQTYKLIKILKKYGNTTGTFIATSIDTTQISESLRKEPLMSKFL